MKNLNSIATTVTDITELILEDHVRLKELIKTLKEPQIKRIEKEAPYEEFALLLINHAKSEEKSLYEKMKMYQGLKIESYEGDTEHTIADQLVQQINATANDDEWTAKVKVLAELVEHHIEEEENEILVMVNKKMDLQTREEVGLEYSKLKAEYDAISMQIPARKEKIYHPALM